MLKNLHKAALILSFTSAILLTGCNDNNKSEKPKIVYDEVQMPYNGESRVYTSSERIAPFTIKTSGSDSYFVKLKDVYTNETVMDIFVRGGNTVETDVPLGTYRIEYATGERWYGYQHLFGERTGYSKTDQSLNFRQDYNGVSGFTISLYKVANGNLQTSYLNPSNF